MLVMLNTLMDISEAESGAMPLQREPVPLADVVDARRRSLPRRRRGEGRRRSRPSAAGDVVVVGDRVRLEQVAANLIDNAVKYTPRGRARRRRGRARRRTARVLRVRDTGVGIPADELPRIWDRLFRGDRSRTERGLGLGLSLVKAIVEAHGGTVDVVERARPRVDVHRLAAARRR